MRIQIDRKSAESLVSQIVRQMKQAAAASPAGAKLPSSRALAQRLGVSRNTVLQAYEALIAEGAVTAQRGSGTRVGPVPTVSRRLNPYCLLRTAQYSSAPIPLKDPDGNALYLIA